MYDLVNRRHVRFSKSSAHMYDLVNRRACVRLPLSTCFGIIIQMEPHTPLVLDVTHVVPDNI